MYGSGTEFVLQIGRRTVRTCHRFTDRHGTGTASRTRRDCPAQGTGAADRTRRGRLSGRPCEPVTVPNLSGRSPRHRRTANGCAVDRERLRLSPSGAPVRAADRPANGCRLSPVRQIGRGAVAGLFQRALKAVARARHERRTCPAARLSEPVRRDCPARSPRAQGTGGERLPIVRRTCHRSEPVRQTIRTADRPAA